MLAERYTSPEDLASEVSVRFAGDEERAAALFYWVANSISYDTKLMNRIAGSSIKSYTLAEIERLYEDRIQYAWKKRKGVCENYARLYERLATLAGLEAVMISGHARGDYLTAGMIGIGHAWNRVKIDGKWQLLDATWGAGHLNENLQFEAEFKPQYFLPEPVTFSYSHFPEDANDQLLANPVSKVTYLMRPAVGEGFLRYDITELNLDTYAIEIGQGNQLTISGMGTDLPSQFILANLSTGYQIGGSTEIAGNQFSITMYAEEVAPMKLGVLNPRGEIVLAYELTVR
ncbi:hypothetical protein A3850_010155 [Lewinella sp. 4G2]|nr:hypothetical protein A3850_010155 [Lewinella sp. 4G2]